MRKWKNGHNHYESGDYDFFFRSKQVFLVYIKNPCYNLFGDKNHSFQWKINRPNMILQWKSFLFAQNPVNWDENDTKIF